MEDKSIPLEERLLKYHKRLHSFDPTFMSDNFVEYRIKQDGNKFWIGQYRGGPTNQFQSYYGTYRQAEDALIRWLDQTNKGKYARYPGCPKPRPTNSTELSLKDWSPKPRR